jgi:predicted phage terminase large subunit-like protein
MGQMATVIGHGPNNEYIGAVYGGNIWWVGPTFTITSIIWRNLKRALCNAWTDKSETEKRIELPGGGSITVRSADNPNSLRGAGLDGLVIDEAAFINKEAWTQSLRPALADKQGWSIKITTPNGFNWFKEDFDAALNRKGWERWQLPTSDNPLIPQEELDEALLDMGPRAFAQEHLAQFVDSEGAEFPAEYFRDSIWFEEWPSMDKLAIKVIGVDPSKGKTDRSDYSAFAMIGLDYTGDLWIDCDMERRDVNRIMQDGVRLCKDFDPDGVAFESNMFQEVLADSFQQVCRESSYMIPLHCIVNKEHKISRIRQTLTPFLARGEMHFRRSRGGRLLVQQLRDFPVGDHDDGPDALEMGVKLLKRLFAGSDSANDIRTEQLAL